MESMTIFQASGLHVMSVPHRVQHPLAAFVIGVVLVFGMAHVLASVKGVRGSGDGDWLYVDHDLAGTRYADLRQITTKNVSQLVKACAYSFPDQEPSQTAPIVSAGRMYLTTAHYTVAVDGADCHVIWSSTWTPREHEPANTHRGAALADGKIIRGTGDGFLLALDAKDGHTLWTRQIADPKEGYFISMAPLVHGKSDLPWAGQGAKRAGPRLGGCVPHHRRRASVAFQYRARRRRARRRHSGA